LQKYKHLKGHYGNAWQRQGIDFKHFPGPVVMTSNCIIEPRRSYKERIFTCGPVAWNNIQEIKDNDFSTVISQALEQEGFTDANKDSTSVKLKE